MNNELHPTVNGQSTKQVWLRIKPDGLPEELQPPQDEVSSQAAKSTPKDDNQEHFLQKFLDNRSTRDR